MGIVYRIKQEIKAQNTTIAAVERELGLGNGTISKWDRQSPSCKNMLKLANYLNCSVDYLLTGKEKSSPTEQLTADEQELLSYYKSLEPFKKGQVMERAKVLSETSKTLVEQPKNTVFIEYYSLPVSAGTGVYLDGCEREMIEVEENPLTLAANFALKVSGNSMEPEFHDGDIVLIESQPSVDIGEIGIFIVNGEGFIKKFGGDCLISLNPEYKNIKLNEYDSIYCRGKVIGVI